MSNSGEASRQAEEDLLRIAMPKGRIFEEAVALFRRAGYPLPDEFEASRKLIVEAEQAKMVFILAKPADVPTYVEYGAADVGVVGKDVLLEEGRDVYELLDLKISRCHLAVAALPDWRPAIYPKVATKFPRLAERYFQEKGQQVEVIKLNGSIELAPIVGLADRIVDIVSTGRTLRENGLVELEKIMEITSRLIANRVSYRMKYSQIEALTRHLEQAVKGEGDGEDC